MNGIVLIMILCILMGCVWVGDWALTELISLSNQACIGQTFDSVAEAIQAKETEVREDMDSSLDVCPPYEVVYSFEYEDSTIVLYRYRMEYDGAVSPDLGICVLKHNGDGTLSFDGGTATFVFNEPTGSENYYYFTNINTDKGEKSISMLYLPAGSEKCVYVDGVKAEKVLASVDGEPFYICYAISHKDTFLTNLFTQVSERHQVEVRGEE